MSSRLDRLMRLAQKTGDTLIIHDKEGHDMVLLDVDRYEMMVDEKDYFVDQEFTDFGLHDLSEGEMLDKINRDIAIWRSHQEQDETSRRAGDLDKDMLENPLPDPFEEDFSHSTDWHHAGSVLEDRHSRFKDETSFEDEHIPNYRFGSSAEPDFGPIVKPYFDEDEEMWDDEGDGMDEFEDFDPQFEVQDTQKDAQSQEEHVDSSLTYDSLGEDSLYDTSQKRDIPFHDHGSVETHKDDDDEPVFFEEPV